MKSLLISVLIVGVVLFTGCKVTPDTKIVNKKVEYDVTDEYIDKTTSWVKTVIENKQGILVQVQLEPDKGLSNLNKMKKAGDIAVILSTEGYGDLADVLYALDEARLHLIKYIETGDAVEFTRGTTYYNQAEELYKKLK